MEHAADAIAAGQSPSGDASRPTPAEVNCYGGVARKP
jgi:hypothetical protein